MRVALVLLEPVVDDVHLAADDRLDALRLRGLEELDRAGQGAVVGERHRGHLELCCLARERGYPARPVEDRVLGVDVQMDERGAHGKAIVLPPLDDLRTVVSRDNSLRQGVRLQSDTCSVRRDSLSTDRRFAPIVRICGTFRTHSSSSRC